MSAKVELPDAVYQALVDAARASGTTPADWIAAHVAAKPHSVSAEERKAANHSLRQLRISLGRPLGIDNNGIDADLAREYGGGHSGLYRTNNDP